MPEPVVSRTTARRLQGCVACLCLFVLGFSSCSRSENLKLGYLGTLSGRFSDLGQSGHSGAILAIEECNRSGGVRGRRVELLEEDDRAEEAAAVQALHSLKQKGAVAVVGPMISKVAQAVVPEANTLELVLMGPTISSNALTGKDDCFFRVYTPSEQTSRQLARQALKLGHRRMLGIYDLANRAHTEGAYRPFADEYVKGGGEALPPITLLGAERPSFTQLARQVAEQKPDLVFVLMSTMDTALFSQCLAKEGAHPQLCCTDWSGTAEIAQFGGRAVDGMLFLYSMDKLGNASFRTVFHRRFGVEPDFAALRAYEAAWVLLQALREEPDPSMLRRTLLTKRCFQVGEALIEFDATGDVVRPHYPYRLVNGAMEPAGGPP